MTTIRQEATDEDYMIRQIVHRWRQILPQGVLEQTGVLLWVISVLVIGLRFTVLVRDQPILLRVLRVGAMTLTGLALALGTTAACIAAARLLRPPVEPSRSQTHPRRLGGGWSVEQRAFELAISFCLALSVDALLAATMIRTAFGWAAQSSLSGPHLAQLAGLAVLHIALAVLHEHRARA